MATFLDISGIQGFSNVFVFVFVWVVVYAALGITKVLGDHKGVNILLGFIVGLFTLFSPVIVDTIQFISPWIAVVLLFGVFATAGFRYLGGSDEHSLGNLKLVTVVVLILIVTVGFLAKLREGVKGPGEGGEEDDFSKPLNVLLHPRILGAIVLMIIAIFTIVLLAGKQYM